MCLETVVVNTILNLEMQDSHYRSDLKRKLSRVAEALHECSMGLDQYYSELKAGEDCLPSFPSPTIVPVPLKTSKPLMQGVFERSDEFCGLKIDGQLGRRNIDLRSCSHPTPEEMRHNLFHAILDSPEEFDVVVKISRTYNKDAHQLLADKGLAPKLFLCERVIGDFFVIIMERVEGDPLHLTEVPVDLQEQFFRDLRHAVKTLAQGGIVHGDLRGPNIVVKESYTGEIVGPQVIDFDWAAEDGKGFYPDTINWSELAEEWHGDVGPMKRMKLEHDEYAVEKVLGPMFCPYACFRNLNDDK